MKKLTVFILTLTVFFSARAERQCIDIFAKPSENFAETFVRLTDYNELLGQTSDRVKHLMVDGGGLCASTCAVNVMHTIYSHMQLGTDFDPLSRMGSVLETVRHLGVDGRYGISMTFLKAAIEEQARYEWRFQTAVDLIEGHYVTEAGLAIRKQQLTILEVSVAGGTHAMVLLRIDPVTQEIDLGDPNYPQYVTRTKYKFVLDALKRKQIRIDLDEPWATTGLIQRQLNVRVFDNYF